ncbi:MAG: hypothetical protein KAU17_16450 [Spirochaetales bacterium]|nr:hypothetical protein [Spirochaetales bacterium]
MSTSAKGDIYVTSFKEYKERYFPNPTEDMNDLPDDPYELGVQLAENTISKVSDLLDQIEKID